MQKVQDSARDRASAIDSDRASDSTSARELDRIEKFLHPHHLLVHKVPKKKLPSRGD